MIEQNKLLEYMEEMKSIAASQQGRLTKEEIGKYLSGMELDDRQMEAVYQYLCASQIIIEGYEYVPENTKDDKEKADAFSGIGQASGSSPVNSKTEDRKKGVKTTSKAQRNLQIYQREVSALEEYTQEQEKELMKRFLAGENQIRDEILHGQLKNVIRLAGKYQERNVPVDEIIAEGNMGLMNAVSILEHNRERFFQEDGQPDMEKVYSVMEMEIKQAMETMIDETTEKKHWEDAIVARTNLLHEAAKYLAEEMGRVATQEELSEYTRIPVEEIREIMDLSEEVRKAF